MARTWEQEKAYCEKRAKELAREMESAIVTLDPDKFRRAYDTAARYMTRKQRRELYRRFLAAASNN